METRKTILYNLMHLKQLVFEVTDLCNLTCKYCALSHLYKRHEKRNGKKLPFEKARLILDYLFSLRAHSPGTNYPLVLSFYGGEPLLNMKLIKQIIAYVDKSKFPKVTYSMTTNAVLLNMHMKFLTENKFLLFISLDGNEANQSYRTDYLGRNSFKRIYKNVILMKKRYPEYFEKYVQFTSVLHNRNSAEETYRYINDHFGKIPQINPLNTVGIRKDRIDEFRQMYQNVKDSFLNSDNCETIEVEMFSLAPRILNLANYIFKHNDNVYKDFNDLFFDISKMNKNQTGTCSPFAKKMFITVDGKILPCERIAHHFSMGQIQDNRVELDLESVASKQNQLISKISKQCKNCYINKECPQCLYNIEDIHKQHFKCSKFCNKNNYERNIDVTINYLREHPHYYEKILNELTLIN